MSTTQDASAAPHLRRSLTLWHVILYGIVVIQPTAPMPLFGVLSDAGRGHAVTTILIAMLAMLLTAMSYGQMARAYPSAGSAFTYVGQELNPAFGYVTGWSMVMDYVLNPIICVIWVSQQAHIFVPRVPYVVWAVVVVLLFTSLNILGVRTSANINGGLAAAMGIVIFLFIVCAARFIVGQPYHDLAFFTRPFYDPATFDRRRVLGATSIAVLTFIGFDGISTLSEETKNPRRNILLATVLTCILIGILAAAEVYAAQLLWPATEPFPDQTTAFSFVAGRAWSPLTTIVGLTLVIASFGSGMAAQLGAARLLFGMGRSNALPKSFFGAIEPKRRIPRNSVVFVGILTLVGAFTLDYELGARMLNFGALLAFMGVNLAALIRYYVRAQEKRWSALTGSVFGFLICLLLWLNLGRTAFLAGTVWMLVGVAFGAWKTRGFQNDLVNFDFAEEELQASA
jgi:putrescine importer